MAFADIDGKKIYYEVHGDGDSIVLLNHGFGSTKMWCDIYPRFVEKGFKVIMYDRWGYGQSEKSGFEEFYISELFRSENVKTLAVLMEILNIPKFNIVAQCEGGVIGADYSVNYPHQVKNLVISSTQCYNKLPMNVFNKIKFSKPYEKLNSKFRESIIYWQGENYAKVYYDLFFKHGGGGAYGRGLFDLRGQLKIIASPTLVLYPDRSPIFDVEQGVESYRCLHSGELAVIPGCGHNTYEDKPEEYMYIVLNFLNRHS